MAIYNYCCKYLKQILIIVILLIITLGTVLRSMDIDLRPLFLDEGVHYGFIQDLWEAQPYKYHYLIQPDTVDFIASDKNNSSSNDAVAGFYSSMMPASLKNIEYVTQIYYYARHLLGNHAYKYDPVYHGPFIYYAGDLVFNIAGHHNFTLLRLPMVIASILGIFYVFLFRKWLGRFGLFLSILLVSLSPGLIYFSNLANYEDYISSINVLGVGLLLAGIYYKRPWVMALAGFVLLMLITIKETALVAWFCIVLSWIMTNIVLYIKNRPSNLLRKLEDSLISLFNGAYNPVLKKYSFPAIVSIVAGCAFFAMLYSSFGGHLQGVHDGLTSWMYWRNTGASSGHVKPFGYYSSLLLNHDFMIAYLAFIGIIITLFTTRDRYKFFISFWALSLWFIYSVIPYKTPWLVLNFLYPLAIAAGIGFDTIFNYLSKPLYKVVLLVFVAVISINTVNHAILAKFFDYDRESNTLTYVHTYREFEEEVKTLYALLKASPEGRKTEITVAAPEYWPIPSYFLKYSSLGYFGGVKGRELNLKAPIIVNDSRDDAELRELLLQSDINDFIKIRSFQVRPGVNHTVYVNKSLFDAFMRKGYFRLATTPGREFLLIEIRN